MLEIRLHTNQVVQNREGSGSPVGLYEEEEEEIAKYFGVVCFVIDLTIQLLGPALVKVQKSKLCWKFVYGQIRS